MQEYFELVLRINFEVQRTENIYRQFIINRFKVRSTVILI